MSRYVIWSKNNCIYCSKAKAILEQKGIDYEERNVEGPVWTSEDFMKAVPPGARTFPQIFQGDKYIGSYDNMMTFWTLGELKL